MQTQPDRFVPDPATIWWGPTFRAAQTMREMPVALPRAQIATAIIFTVLALALSLFGPLAWGHAARELARIRAGQCNDRGRGWLLLELVVGVATTVLLTMIIVFLSAGRAAFR